MGIAGGFLPVMFLYPLDTNKFSNQVLHNYTMATLLPNPDDNGFYGNFGGAFIPEILRQNISDLNKAFSQLVDTPEFQKEFHDLLRDYVGRPSPLYKAQRLSQHFNTNIYLKREDLNHTGSHKINNAIGQALLAKRMGKHRIIAETGAGQHGVATATVCALLGMECNIYMGATDIARQKSNVDLMKMLGATVIPVTTGNSTLKDAVDEALRDWCNNPQDTFYLLGSAVGPHPYPNMVARFQSIISEEIINQFPSLTGKEYPDYVVACIGGGSNASGAFFNFVDKPQVKLIAVEAAGKGVNSGLTAASLSVGSEGILHGFRTMLIQDNQGNPVAPYSISAGLDYPGIGPMLAWLASINRIIVEAATDDEALSAAYLLTRLEGIIPALESSHALAVLSKRQFLPTDNVIINLSGRGDKDLSTYLQHRQ